jgi:hypothetical protein
MSRLLAKITLICAGAVGLALGAHGLYICCYLRLADFLGRDATDIEMTSFSLSSQEDLSRLFLVWDVPNPLQGLVLWATTSGFESCFVPAVLIVVGILLLRAHKVA